MHSANSVSESCLNSCILKYTKNRTKLSRKDLKRLNNDMKYPCNGHKLSPIAVYNISQQRRHNLY